MERISWNQYFMAQSHLLASRSTCHRLMVGATIVRDNRIIAGGYNGSVAREAHCIDGECLMDHGHCIRTVHAEMNAILQCAKFGASTEQAELYVTHYPCVNCSKAIIQAGIKKVHFAQDYHNHPYAHQLFKQAQVETVHVPLDPVYSQHFAVELKKDVLAALSQLPETTENVTLIKAVKKQL
ncbi:ComE operon protein 2 [Brochothrix thermosphacta]|uniref:ComE operon protein 2 n=1 Tax=Brochothrix thermosphacta TaxID=2756 RepID=UPI0009C13324|nr:ComE operon protein 2 [Brochothrix thermosphacta]